MMFLLLALIGFLIGSIPSGYLSMRFFTGADIRTMGTGSATVTAVMIHGGRIPGIVALLMEITKAILLFLIAHFLVGEAWAVLAIIVAAVIGCSWSVWLKGNGGQGLTIGVTGLVLLNPLPVLIMAACYLIPIVATKRHLLSNRLFRISIPVVLWLWYSSWVWVLAGVLIVLPSFVKGRIYGDEVAEAQKTSQVGHNESGA